MQTRPNFDITPIERRLLWRIRQMPESYLRNRTLSELVTWMNGYDLGIRFSGTDTEEHNILPDGLNQYAIETILGKKTSPMGWHMILLQENGQDEERAFLEAWQFLDHYLRYRGFPPINQKTCQELCSALAEKKRHTKFDLCPEPAPFPVRDLTQRERNFLAILLKRPGMYTGTNKFSGFAALESGFRTAMLATQNTNNFCLMPPELHEYICEALHKGMDGCDAILQHEPDEQKAWELFRKLYDQYLTKHGYAPLSDFVPLDMEALARSYGECSDIGSAERTLLGRIKKHPAVYLGLASSKAFFHFCKGYTLAAETMGMQENHCILPEGFVETAAKLYEYCWFGVGETPLYNIWEYLDVYLRVHGYAEIEECDLPKAEVTVHHGEEGERPVRERVNEDIGDEQRCILCRIQNHPEAFFGETRTPLSDLFTFMHGWNSALLTMDGNCAGALYSANQLIPGELHRFTANKFLGLEHTAKGWASLILEQEPDEKKAFFMFWEILDDYFLENGYKPLAYRNIEEYTCEVNQVRWISKELAASFAHTFNAPPWNDSWTQEQVMKRLTDLRNTPNFDGMLAFVNGKLAGAILGRGEQYFDGMVFQILEFWTEPRLQGSGLGSKLLSEFAEHLGKQGIHRIFLLTMRGERTEGFYQKQGFETAEGLCYMTKTLGESNIQKENT